MITREKQEHVYPTNEFDVGRSLGQKKLNKKKQREKSLFITDHSI